MVYTTSKSQDDANAPMVAKDIQIKESEPQKIKHPLLLILALSFSLWAIIWSLVSWLAQTI